MANAKNLEAKAMKILLYGPSGVGKTTLAATFPNVHFVDLDNGMLSVAGKDIDYITINSRETTDPDFIKLFPKMVKQRAWLKSVAIIEHWANELKEGDTLVLDSFSLFTDYAIEQILALESRTSMRIQDWGSARGLLETTLEALNNVECNLIVNAHEEFIVDKESGAVSWMPLTIGKLKTKIPIYFDEVWRCYSEPGKGSAKGTQIYGIETKPTRRTTAKSRLHLPTKFENVSYSTIMAEWEKNKPK